ncbi:S24 family peptidase [Halomonas sp. PAMB 3264]|uniref:S24 family peptidase n=1 Tax=Halomonas sp. PAMB 3264 TaxID=3075222 RepID=UPI00289ED76C|nr:S24 family peptidase [Halomonas sp. PAMB 3264]WNL41339.1 S24 family peptidase [Halomonas sp. PAMB 3264]
MVQLERMQRFLMGDLMVGEQIIKRVQRLAEGALYLISDNELYQPKMIKPQDMGGLEILGRCEIRIGRVV